MVLILASASPRRRELLSRLTGNFLVAPGAVEETHRGEAPAESVVGLARAKALDVAKQWAGLILAADTVAVLGDEILGKPESRDHARAMLSRLSARDHDVLTGVCILSTWSGEESCFCERTEVRFRRLETEEIERYLDTGEYVDKAAAYAIQGRAAAFVERICGEYTNVMGLPLCRVAVTLRRMGLRV